MGLGKPCERVEIQAKGILWVVLGGKSLCMFNSFTLEPANAWKNPDYDLKHMASSKEYGAESKERSQAAKFVQPGCLAALRRQSLGVPF